MNPMMMMNIIRGPGLRWSYACTEFSKLRKNELIDIALEYVNIPRNVLLGYTKQEIIKLFLGDVDLNDVVVPDNYSIPTYGIYFK